MKKRTIFFLASLYLTSMAASAVLFNIPRNEVKNVSGERWVARQKENRNRLAEVPVILYHNIDGKGPFSVSSKMLREHFSYMRDNGVRIVPLKDLVARMERGEAYPDRVAVLTFDDGFKSMRAKLLPMAKEFGYPVTLFVYVDFVRNRSEKMLTWEDVRELEANGIDVESHTVTHSDLSLLMMKDDEPDRLQLFRELYLSRRIIALESGSSCEYLAYPYGNYNTGVVYLSKLAGYTRVFSTEYGMNPVTSDNYCLRRHHIKSNYTIEDLRKILEI